MQFEDFFKLPFEIQVVLVAGYLAYRVATIGIDRHHKTTDTIFQVLVYGLPAYVFYIVASPWIAPFFAAPGAVLIAVCIAFFWRKIGRSDFAALIRQLAITKENYWPTTWDHLIQAPNTWAYIAVNCDDNSVLESDLSILPENLPFHGIDVDSAGNVAIYVTRILNPEGEPNELGISGAIDQYGRAHITYIPAARIKNITVSVKAKVIS